MTIYDMLYRYQREAADKIVKARRQAIFDDPGLGKTITVLAALEQAQLFENNAKVLVLATKTGAALTWLPHAYKLLPKDVLIVDAVRRSLTTRRAMVSVALEADTPAIVIANHDFIAQSEKSELLHTHPIYTSTWDAIVIDESQRVLPTQAEHEAALSRFWRGLRTLKTHATSLRVPMSGTPDRGKLENRYGTLAFLLPEAYDFTVMPYERWLFKTFHLTYKQTWIRVRGRPFEVQSYRVGSIRNPDAWHELDKMLTIRRTKAEVATQLPPKRYVKVELPWAKNQEKAYLDYLKEFSAKDDGTDRAAETFTTRSTQFAICEFDVQPAPGGGTTGVPVAGGDSPKRDWIVEWLQERDYDTDTPRGQVVITSQFAAVLRWLHTELEAVGITSIGVLTGAESTNQRLAAQKAFQEGETGIMLLSMTLGDSIDLDAADDMIFVDLVHDPDKVTQAEDRVHRVSRMHNVVIWRLITTGSVDPVIDAVNDRRFNITRGVMDGARGVEDFARNVIARFAA